MYPNMYHAHVPRQVRAYTRPHGRSAHGHTRPRRFLRIKHQPRTVGAPRLSRAPAARRVGPGRPSHAAPACALNCAPAGAPTVPQTSERQHSTLRAPRDPVKNFANAEFGETRRFSRIGFLPGAGGYRWVPYIRAHATPHNDDQEDRSPLATVFSIGNTCSRHGGGFWLWFAMHA